MSSEKKRGRQWKNEYVVFSSLKSKQSQLVFLASLYCFCCNMCTSINTYNDMLYHYTDAIILYVSLWHSHRQIEAEEHSIVHFICSPMCALSHLTSNRFSFSPFHWVRNGTHRISEPIGTQTFVGIFKIQIVVSRCLFHFISVSSCFSSLLCGREAIFRDFL